MTVWRFTLMPARRDASKLPPMATVRRPKVVRESRNQPTAAAMAKIQISRSTPNRSPRKNSLKSMTLMIWVCLLDSISARPRAATSMARVAMNGTTRP